MTNETAYFADLGDHPTWRVAGGNVLGFLNDMLTQDVSGLQPGTGALAALLTDKGRVRAVVRVLATAEGALIDADDAATPGIEQGLAGFAPLAGVEMTVHAVVLLRIAGDPPSQIDGAAGRAVHDHAQIAGATVVRTAFGMDVLAAPQAADAWRARLATVAQAVAPPALEAARIRARMPRYGDDVDDQTLINESPLLDTAVSFTKGCYPGQESVARVRNLGRVRRRLVVLNIDGTAAPPSGAVVTKPGGDQAGHVTSSGSDGNGVVAFAVIDAKAADAGALTVEGTPASIAGDLSRSEPDGPAGEDR